eukprot:7149890-Pyramimonas_sp.AAC.1
MLTSSCAPARVGGFIARVYEEWALASTGGYRFAFSISGVFFDAAVSATGSNVQTCLDFCARAIGRLGHIFLHLR